MRKLIFILLIIHCSLLIAQTPTQEWVARIPGPSNDLIGPFFAVDKNGNSYVAGTHVINDSINILVVKYNTSGAQEWYTLYKYPGEGIFAPEGIALDSSGNAYIISLYGQGISSPLNGLIVKFSSINGSPVWAKRHIGQYGTSAFYDIKIDRLNNIYVVGSSDTSHLAIRYNTNGDSVWVRKYHPPFCREYALACTIDDSLNVILTGERIHSYDTLIVAKYSSGGVLRWVSTYAQGVSANVGLKITADQNGNAYIGGVTTVSGFGVYLTLKYDRNGIRQWVSIYDGPGSGANTLSGIVSDINYNCVLVTGNSPGVNNSTAATIKYNASTGDSNWVRRDTGIFRNAESNDIKVDVLGNTYITGGTYTTPPNTGAILTIKYTPQGNLGWLITYSGPGRSLALVLDTSNNVYICGYYDGDYIVIKYSQLVGIKITGNKTPKFFEIHQNYPNPFNANTKIRISVPRRSLIQLLIYDVLGRVKDVIIDKELYASEYEIAFNGTNYSSGLYFYQLVANGIIIETKKFIIVK